MRLTALAFLLALVLPTSARAAGNPDQPTAVAKTVFMHGEDPADPGHCTAAVFAQFTDKKGFVAQNWMTTFHAPNGSTRPASDALTPPDYGDTYTFGAIVWKAPAGTHWAFVSHTYADGPGRCDGAEYEAKYRNFYPDPIVITYGLTEQCRSAKSSVQNAKTNIAYAKKRLKGTKGSERKAILKQLKSYKAYLKRSQKAKKKSC